MLSTSREDFVPFPKDCDKVVAATSKAVILDCETQLKFYSYRERNILSEYKKPPGTVCGGQLLFKKRLIIICRNNITSKLSKVTAISADLRKKTFGDLRLRGGPLVT